MPHIKISTYNSANNYENPIIFEDNISEEQSEKIHEFFKKLQIKKEELKNKVKNQPMKNGTVVTPEFKIKYEIGDKNKKGENNNEQEPNLQIRGRSKGHRLRKRSSRA